MGSPRAPAFAAMSSLPTGRGSKRVASDMARSFVASSSSVLKQINKDLEGNLELQQIVQAKIAEYQEVKKEALAAGMSVSDLVASQIQERKRKKASESDSDSGDRKAKKEKTEKPKEVAIENPETILRRGQVTFGNWSAKLCRELIGYCDPELDTVGLKRLSLESLHQCLEAGWELKLLGDSKDRIGTTHKGNLFQNLKKVYEQLGCRLRGLEIDMAEGKVMWDSVSPLSVKEKNDAGDLEVHYQPKGGQLKVRYLAHDDLNDDPGPFVMIRHWSLFNAVVKGSRGEYLVGGLFVTVGRKLCRRTSEEMGVCKVSAEEHKQLKKDKEERKRPKAQTTGIRLLSQREKKKTDNNDEKPSDGHGLVARGSGGASSGGAAARPEGQSTPQRGHGAKKADDEDDQDAEESPPPSPAEK